MKRWIKTAQDEKDEFDIAWEKKFGPEQVRVFDSTEEFDKWMQEVDEFTKQFDRAAKLI